MKEKPVRQSPVRASIEELRIVLLDENTLTEIERYIGACERCAGHAAIELNYLLDGLTGCDPTVTTYLMCRPARCRSCSATITEKTLVAV